MNVRVGIGSWADDAYTGVLYPKGLPRAERLRAYTEHFDHVEVNSSYYAIPKKDTVSGWAQQTPDHFTFSIKLHRAIALSPEKAAAKGTLVKALLENLTPLAEKSRLLSFLLVLPPTFTPERRRLEELDRLSEALRPHLLAVELRDKAWVSGTQRAATLAYFRDRELVWVAVDMPRIPGSSLMPAVDEVTHPKLGYVRLHGRNPAYLEAGSAAEGHHYAYSTREISAIATRVRRLSTQAERVLVIANNHSEDFAPKAALALRKTLGRKARA